MGNVVTTTGSFLEPLVPTKLKFGLLTKQCLFGFTNEFPGQYFPPVLWNITAVSAPVSTHSVSILHQKSSPSLCQRQLLSITCNGLFLVPPQPISSLYLFILQRSSLLNYNVVSIFWIHHTKFGIVAGGSLFSIVNIDDSAQEAAFYLPPAYSFHGKIKPPFTSKCVNYADTSQIILIRQTTMK